MTSLDDENTPVRALRETSSKDAPGGAYEEDETEWWYERDTDLHRR